MTTSAYIKARSQGDPITPREDDVLEFVGKGWMNKQISHQLGISEATVKAHIRSLLIKLGARNRVQLALLQHGIDL